jgi:hypothetical protein
MKTKIVILQTSHNGFMLCREELEKRISKYSTMRLTSTRNGLPDSDNSSSPAPSVVPRKEWLKWFRRRGSAIQSWFA